MSAPETRTDVEIRCGGCGEPLVLPGLVLPSDRIGEQWDLVAPMLPPRNWSVAKDGGGRYPLCPACTRDHARRQTIAGLPPFDEGANCPKCHHAEVSTTYCPGRTSVCPLDRPHEHLHRICRRCGYLWGEATADANDHEPPADHGPEALDRGGAAARGDDRPGQAGSDPAGAGPGDAAPAPAQPDDADAAGDERTVHGPVTEATCHADDPIRNNC